jgi:hypothetical protein
MKNQADQNCGIKLLMKKYREMFRVPENLNFYSEADLKIAERSFVRFAMARGAVPVQKKR